MVDRRFGWILAFAFVMAHSGLSRPSRAQGPTIEGTGIIPSAGITTTPGSLNSLLDLLPGSSGAAFGSQPGRDDLLLGRIGNAAPRVPTGITMPGGPYQGPQARPMAAATQPLPLPRPLLYGSLELPAHDDRRGPRRWPHARPGDRLARASKPRPAGQTARDPPGARRCFDGQPSGQSAFLRRQPACPLWFRFGPPSGRPYAI